MRSWCSGCDAAKCAYILDDEGWFLKNQSRTKIAILGEECNIGDNTLIAR